jgi:two-component system, OmpR family, sensor histidine kinase KdpD
VLTPRAGPQGRLKVYLGASPGVGKTFAMLEAAREARRAGRDVIVGIVETHGRAETAALLEGFEQLPRRRLVHGTSTPEEFDLDAALARRPDLLLLDELAHTNAPGSRHARRWQDALELRAAGVDVLTTLNIQHVASLRDVVAGITGITVHEMVPDAVLDEADELELVDVSVDVLEQRLRDGKVYLPERAERALQHFFRRSNLVALRQLALRQTATRLEPEPTAAHARSAVAGERVLVAVGDAPDAVDLVRAGWRLAGALGAACLVVHVELATGEPLSREAQAALDLAASLGATVRRATGDDVAATLATLVRQERITRVMLHAPRQRRWGRDAIAARLSREGCHVVIEPRAGNVTTRPVAAPPRAVPAAAMLRAVVGVTAATAAGFLVRDVLSTADLAMLFVVAIAVAGAHPHPAAGVVAAVLSIICFDFIFVPPYYTFAVSDVRYVLTFAVMLGAGIVVSRLTSRLQRASHSAATRARETTALLNVARDLAAATTPDEAAHATTMHLRDVTHRDVVVLMPAPSTGRPPLDDVDACDHAAATWAWEHGETAGAGTATLPATPTTWRPLRAGGRTVALLGLHDPLPGTTADAERFVAGVAEQAAGAIARLELERQRRRDEVAIEAERLRSTLLSSFSHDLRTPLASVHGAATTLLREAERLSTAVREELLRSIADESDRMSRLVTGLLDLSRLEAGPLDLQHEWQSIEELLALVRLRVEASHPDLRVEVDVPAELPLIRGDGLLLEQVFLNLLENAALHARSAAEVRVAIRVQAPWLEVRVHDNGPGVPAEDLERIFEKFQRGSTATSRGSGLGLAICRAVVHAHGGQISAHNRASGGFEVRIALPLPADPPPPVPMEEP